MIAVKAVILLGILIYKLLQHFPGVEFKHLLVDYHFGLIKRALVGATLGLFLPKVAIWHVFLVGGILLVVAIALYVMLFRKAFGFNQSTLPLFVFTACSPAFFGNFFQNIGYFDIFGCIAALILLLIPSRSLLYVAIGAALSATLILIHHIHLLMYVPLLTAIVIARYYLAHPRNAGDIYFGMIAGCVIVAVFIFIQFFGTPPVPPPAFEAYMTSRVAEFPAREQEASIWYSTLRNEIVSTWATMGKNLIRAPIYGLILAAHAPLIAYFRRSVDALIEPTQRKLVWLAVILISAGYVVIFATVYDYSRWFANWSVCMILLLFAIQSLSRASVEPIAADSVSNKRLGWIVAVIPRIGTTIPF